MEGVFIKIWLTGILYRAWQSQRMAILQLPQSSTQPNMGLPVSLQNQYTQALICLPDSVDDMLDIMKVDMKEVIFPDKLLPKNNQKWLQFISNCNQEVNVDRDSTRPDGGGLVRITSSDDDSVVYTRQNQHEFEQLMPTLAEFNERDRTVTED